MTKSKLNCMVRSCCFRMEEVRLVDRCRSGLRLDGPTRWLTDRASRSWMETRYCLIRLPNHCPSCFASNLLNHSLSDWLTMERCSFRCNSGAHYWMVCFPSLNDFQIRSPSRLIRLCFRSHWNRLRNQIRCHWSSWVASNSATNNSAQRHCRCWDLANLTYSPIGCRFASWSIHFQNYQIGYYRYRSNRSGWSRCHWMRLSSWCCTNDYSWHRLSTNRFHGMNPIHSIQTDWNPIRSSRICLSQTHSRLIHWNHWIGLNHSTRSLIRSTSNCLSRKVCSVIRLNHLMNRWTRKNQNLMNGSNRSSLKPRSLNQTNLMRGTRGREAG